MARNGYSDEVKAQVMAALLTGQAVSEIAAKYNIPEDTIWTWKRRSKKLNDLNGDEKRDRIAELVISYLEAELESLRAIATFCADSKWLQKQGASEIGVLKGVTCDKVIRILEALGDQAEEADAG